MTGNTVEQATGTLFGDLWRRYDDRLFDESLRLFEMRFRANGFDLEWFRGKDCLDAGCGGGRYTLALARLGARVAVGCDLSLAGLADAATRVRDHSGVHFLGGSVLQLPHPDGTFDFVCCSGVLHHTPDPTRGLGELTRVLRPGGRLYVLLYGTGGVRWPTIMRVREHAQAMGYETVDKAIQRAGLPANKQRTFLDDLFVPIIRFFEWDEVREMLAGHGYREVQRWERGRLDNEENIEAQRVELEQLASVFEAARDLDGGVRGEAAARVVAGAIAEVDAVTADVAAGTIGETERRRRTFGWGHHRVLATKP